MAIDRSPFRRKQLGVAAGMAVGLVITVAVFLWPAPRLGSEELSDRLRQWLACDLVVGLWLLGGVARLARHRLFDTADIDGALAGPTPKAAILQSQVQNTLEQVVLAVIACGAWMLVAAPAGPAIAWRTVACFSAGRLLFFIGYARGAAARSLGFALTFYPTVGLMIVSAVVLIRATAG